MTERTLDAYEGLIIGFYTRAEGKLSMKFSTRKRLLENAPSSIYETDLLAHPDPAAAGPVAPAPAPAPTPVPGFEDDQDESAFGQDNNDSTFSDTQLVVLGAILGVICTLLYW